MDTREIRYNSDTGGTAIFVYIPVTKHIINIIPNIKPGFEIEFARAMEKESGIPLAVIKDHPYYVKMLDANKAALTDELEKLNILSTEKLDKETLRKKIIEEIEKRQKNGISVTLKSIGNALERNGKTIQRHLKDMGKSITDFKK